MHVSEQAWHHHDIRLGVNQAVALHKRVRRVLEYFQVVFLRVEEQELQFVLGIDCDQIGVGSDLLNGLDHRFVFEHVVVKPIDLLAKLGSDVVNAKSPFRPLRVLLEYCDGIFVVDGLEDAVRKVQSLTDRLLCDSSVRSWKVGDQNLIACGLFHQETSGSLKNKQFHHKDIVSIVFET